VNARQALTFWGLLALGGLSACTPSDEPSAGGEPPGTSIPEPGAAGGTASGYVGRASCAECHTEATEAWRGSDHDLAMDIATEETVLGDFDDATFTHYGVTSSFFRRNGGFFVETDGPDGELTEFEIKYTFGVRPLQQYLVEFPDGRVQTLALCWDTRPASDGGQRWFHIYPDEPIPHDDILHWTGPAQNWNYMCAECHSTNVRKGYVAKEDRYETMFSEIDVSCETCHGPGLRHVTWARKKTQGATPPSQLDVPYGGDLGLDVGFGNTDGGAWAMTESGNAKRSVPRTSRVEIETCARCHARRTMLSEDYVAGRPLLNTHRVALLTDVLYHPDGQIRDEVYVYGSFIQSKMYAEGVTCSDCHDAHSGRLRAEGNALCAKCHLASKFDTPEHHFHKPDSTGASCVECHMPETIYMVVDPRRDHSMRVPRPDLSMTLGSPNACNRCHADKSVQWSVDAVSKWYGPNRRLEPHWGEAIHAANSWEIDAGEQILGLARDESVPGIARATAVSLLPNYPSGAVISTLESALRDEDPLVRLAALDALEYVDPQSRLRLGYRHLSDSTGVIRGQAARVLASVPTTMLAQEQRDRVSQGLEEYLASQHLNGDRAESYVNLGNLHLMRGDPIDAERAFERAIDMMPGFAPAWINLADLMRARNRDDEGERVLRNALKAVPEIQAADVHHALGLWLVRQERHSEALTELEHAADLQPDVPRFAYVLAVGLHSTGDVDGARELLESAVERFPGHAGIREFHTQLQTGR
jgi:predicted CXXCH cytochrome family protein